MNTLPLPSGATIPTLGLGTWRLGESRASRAAEVAVVRTAIEIGYRLIDTAEMYGEGGAEEVVGQAVAEALRAGDVRRDELFIVSKVYPHNASRVGVQAACDRSRKRLGLDQLDLYLLHWRGRIPLAETVAAFERLRRDGKIVHWGVSNFDTADMEELWAVPEGRRCATNQVLYHLGERSVEWALLPWMRAHRMPLMAYCPLGEGRLLADHRLATLATRLGAGAAEVALGWLIRQGDVIAIPQSSDPRHLRANRAATEVRFDAAALASVDAAFPPPAGASPLVIV